MRDAAVQSTHAFPWPCAVRQCVAPCSKSRPERRVRTADVGNTDRGGGVGEVTEDTRGRNAPPPPRRGCGCGAGEGWRAGRCRHRCDDGGRTIGEGRRARGHTHAARGYVTGSSERLSVSRAIGAGRHAIERWWWWWWRRTSPSPSCDASGVSPRTRANQVAYSPGGGVTLDLARALAARGPRVRCGAGADHGARARG